jgi:hypothetical protein
LTGSPLQLFSGVGIDAGITYRWAEIIAVAVTGDNLFTPTATLSYDELSGFLDASADAGSPAYGTVPQAINFGVAYTPGLGRAERYVRDLAVLLDYRDAFDFWLDPANAENFILKLGLGVEARLLQALSLRAGFSQGLFAAGLGIDMPVVKITAAVYGTELSAEPGLRPVYNIIFGLEFRQ